MLDKIQTFFRTNNRGLPRFTETKKQKKAEKWQGGIWEKNGAGCKKNIHFCGAPACNAADRWLFLEEKD